MERDDRLLLHVVRSEAVTTARNIVNSMVVPPSERTTKNLKLGAIPFDDRPTCVHGEVISMKPAEIEVTEEHEHA